MKLGVYSVYDAAVGAYLPPWFARAKGEALRSFVSACNDEKHQFAIHAHDFVLYELGEFDDASGVFVCPKAPVRVISALETVVKEEPVDSGPGPELRKRLAM